MKHFCKVNEKNVSKIVFKEVNKHICSKRREGNKNLDDALLKLKPLSYVFVRICGYSLFFFFVFVIVNLFKISHC